MDEHGNVNGDGDVNENRFAENKGSSELIVLVGREYGDGRGGAMIFSRENH